MRIIGVAAVGAAIVVAAACAGSTSKTAKAQWFDACSADEECAEGSCWCGVCTRTCADDGECRSAGASATCVEAPAACTGGSAAPSGGVCVAQCSRDADCAAGSVCRGGSCWRETSPGSGGGTNADGGPSSGSGGSGGASASGGRTSGGTNGSGGRGPSSGSGGRPSPSDFADVKVPMDFTNPVSLPPPDVHFAGNLDEIVGTWAEKNSAGQPCTPDASGSDLGGTVCTRLEIVKNADGTFRGTMSRASSLLNEPRVKGPFAPPTDFDVGYPTELEPKQYGDAREFTPEVEYRVFDGTFRDGVLSFWISPLDLWQDWCARQTPYVWEIEGRKEYRCVPQTADASNTDLGKMALCTSAEDFPMCQEKNGNPAPCPCVNEENGWFDFSLPLCSLAYCECSQTNCVAFTRNTSVASRFQLRGGELIGNVTVTTPGNTPVTLMRISP